MGLAHLWWNVSLREFVPTSVSVYGNGIPLVAVLVGWLFLVENLYLRHLVGGRIILVGVLLARTDNRRRKRTAGPPES